MVAASQLLSEFNNALLKPVHILTNWVVTLSFQATHSDEKIIHAAFLWFLCPISSTFQKSQVVSDRDQFPILLAKWKANFIFAVQKWEVDLASDGSRPANGSLTKEPIAYAFGWITPFLAFNTTLHQDTMQQRIGTFLAETVYSSLAMWEWIPIIWCDDASCSFREVLKYSSICWISKSKEALWVISESASRGRGRQSHLLLPRARTEKASCWAQSNKD